MRSTTKVFKALSDANRLRILKMLEIRPLCVCEITEVLRLANSTVSKHLSILRDADLILDEKDGKWVNYSLKAEMDDHQRKQLLRSVQYMLADDQTVLQDRKKIKSINRHIICGQTVNTQTGMKE